MGLTLDPQLIRDLTVLITSSTVGGMIMEALRQPVINGYFIAGSVVGPGGLRLVKVGFHTDPRLHTWGSRDHATAPRTRMQQQERSSLQGVEWLHNVEVL